MRIDIIFLLLFREFFCKQYDVYLTINNILHIDIYLRYAAYTNQ